MNEIDSELPEGFLNIPTRAAMTDIIIGKLVEDYDASGFKATGMSYRRSGDDLIGSDPERPELGEKTVTIKDGDIEAAKLELMATFCADVPEEWKSRRIFLKEVAWP